MLPAPRRDAGRDCAGHFTAHRADEGPGGRAAGARDCGVPARLQPYRGGNPARLCRPPRGRLEAALRRPGAAFGRGFHRERDPATMAARQVELFAKREDRDSQRLAQVLEFARQPGCITRRLLAYFGELLADENCGHCHFCRTGLPNTAVDLPVTRIAPFTEDDLEAIRGLISEEHPSLSTARKLTRLLCGLSSPATSRAKLTRRREFGRFSATPFRTVLAQVQECWGGED